jgi:hypothetical protein
MLRCTSDGMCLSAACSAVGENGRIVAIEHAIEEGSSSAFIYIGLCCVFVEDAVESKDLIFDLLRRG